MSLALYRMAVLLGSFSLFPAHAGVILSPLSFSTTSGSPFSSTNLEVLLKASAMRDIFNISGVEVARLGFSTVPGTLPSTSDNF